MAELVEYQYLKHPGLLVVGSDNAMTVVPILTRDARHHNVFTPKGLNIIAQGKRSAALGGKAVKNTQP